MALLGQFYLSEQHLGEKKLFVFNRKLSRKRILLGSTVRKSLTPNRYGGTVKHPKEITYQRSRGAQQRKRYKVTVIPSSPKYDAVWSVFRAAVAAWQALSQDEKIVYNLRARVKNLMSGHNLFVGEYINEHY